MWRKPPNELSIPYINNTMPIDVLKFMQHNIQFSDNSKIKQKGVHGYDYIFKVSYPL